jgi:hypothetical protein
LVLAALPEGRGPKATDFAVNSSAAAPLKVPPDAASSAAPKQHAIMKQRFRFILYPE